MGLNRGWRETSASLCYLPSEGAFTLQDDDYITGMTAEGVVVCSGEGIIGDRRRERPRGRHRIWGSFYPECQILKRTLGMGKEELLALFVHQRWYPLLLTEFVDWHSR